MDKLTQKEAILELFILHDGVVTLAQILKTPLAAEYRARFSEMRGEGYEIIYKKGETPSQNTYTLKEHTTPRHPQGHLKDESAKMVPLCDSESKSVEHLLNRCKKTLSLHQINTPCKCGSYYRRGNNCNVCGAETNDLPEEMPGMKAKRMKMLWNKKLHRYLTQDEIKSGMLGG